MQWTLTLGVGWHTAVGLNASEFESIKRGIDVKLEAIDISTLVCGLIVEGLDPIDMCADGAGIGEDIKLDVRLSLSITEESFR